MPFIKNLSAWQTQLDSIQGRLKKLNETSEDEFLVFGSKLQEIYFNTKKIAAASSSVSKELAGDEMSTVVDGLQNLLSEMDKHLGQSEGTSKRSEDTLHEIEDNLHLLYKPLDGFKKIIRTLNILGIHTRVENANIASQRNDFEQLSGQVKELSTVIDAKIQSMVHDCSTLERLIGSTISEVAGLQLRQDALAQVMLEDTRANLKALTGKQEASSGTICVISEKSEMITGKIGKIVSSVQFNDITRQQLEHVIDALAELSSGIHFHDSSEAEQTDLVSTFGNVCELQSAQTGLARTDLAAAINKIFDSLRDVGSSIRELSLQINNLTGSTGGDSTSFLSEMDADIKKISSSLQENARMGKEIAKSINTVVETVTKMSTYLNDIEAIGKDIEMIAVNAIVKASNLGNQGAALAVVAEFIKKTAVTTREEIAIISGLLKQVSSAACNLSSGIHENIKHNNTQLNSMVGGLGDSLKTLSALNDNLMTSLSDINTKADQLEKDIETGVAQLCIHEKFSLVLDAIQTELGQIVHTADELAPGRQSARQADNLDGLESQYTMESERKIHEALLSGETSLTDVSENPQDESLVVLNDDDTLGDFIELF